MLWAKWWTAILAATLLSLTLLAARANAQEPSANPNLQPAGTARAVATAPNHVTAWGVPATSLLASYNSDDEPRVEG